MNQYSDFAKSTFANTAVMSNSQNIILSSYLSISQCIHKWGRCSVFSTVKAPISRVQDVASEAGIKFIVLIGQGLVCQGLCIHTHWFVRSSIGKMVLQITTSVYLFMSKVVEFWTLKADNTLYFFVCVCIAYAMCVWNALYVIVHWVSLEFYKNYSPLTFISKHI